MFSFFFFRDNSNYHLKEEPPLKAVKGPQLRDPKALGRGILTVTSVCSFNVLKFGIKSHLNIY